MRVRSAVLLAVAAALARADGPLLTPGEQVLGELARAVERGEADHAGVLLREAGAIYRYPASPKEADALLEAIGAATRAKQPGIVAAALDALAETGNAKAITYVEPFLRPARPAAGEEPVMVAAVRAAGRLRAPEALPELLRLASKCPDLVVADLALGALAEYCGAEPAQRAAVAGKVLDTCQLLVRQRARWDRLRAPGLRALQRLIGRKLNTVGQFADWWRWAKTQDDPFR
jgi:hypothetical protein